MQLCWCITIREVSTSCCGLSLRNRSLCAFFGFAQLLVAAISLLQHAFSLRSHKHVFYCLTNITTTSTPSEKVDKFRSVFDFKPIILIIAYQQFLGYDIIIYDYGLMHRILGTNECVANYLDGGFMRSLWCINHTFALIILPVALYCIRKPLWLLWPALLMQSAYALGLGVLTMAIAPKLLEAFGGKVDSKLVLQFSIYSTGFALNWLFTLILWHYYWYMEKLLAHIPNDTD